MTETRVNLVRMPNQRLCQTDDAPEWTCYVRRLPGVHVYKPYVLHLLHDMVPFADKRIYFPGTWNRIGQNVIARVLKGGKP